MKIGLVALGGIALLGFLAPAIGSSLWELWIPQLLFLLIAAFFIGRVAGPPGPVLGGVIGLVGLLAAMYGNYAAHVLGFWGLEASDFGSDDSPGWNTIALGLLFFGLPVTLLGGLAGFVGAMTSPSHRA